MLCILTEKKEFSQPKRLLVVDYAKDGKKPVIVREGYLFVGMSKREALDQNELLKKGSSIIHDGNVPATRYWGKNTSVVCYFTITIDNVRCGRIIFELFKAFVPKTVENFVQFCLKPPGQGFKGCIFHRIIPGFIMQGGDFTKGNGAGGYSVEYSVLVIFA